MSNLIPPLLSSSPPPIVGPLDEEDDDEFGDFRAGAESFDCDESSIPSSPQKTPEKDIESLDINRNNEKRNDNPLFTKEAIESLEESKKDYQDRRKNETNNQHNALSIESESISVNSTYSENNLNSTIAGGNEITEENSIPVLNGCDLSVDVNNECLETELISNKKENREIDDDFGEFENFSNQITSEVRSTNESPSIIENDFKINSCIDERDFNFGQNVELREDNEAIHEEKSISETTKGDDTPPPVKNSQIGEDLDDFGSLNTTSRIENVEVNENDDFKTFEQPPSVPEVKKEENSFEAEDDEFGTFEEAQNLQKNTELENSEVSAKIDDEGEEFGTFESPPTQIIEEQCENQATTEETNDDSDDFGDFAAVSDQFGNFESLQNSTVPADPNNFGAFESSADNDDDDDDEFGEFGDFSSLSDRPTIITNELNIKDALNKSESILKEIFPEINNENDEVQFIDVTNDNKIFTELKDVTETNALIYQWSKSDSQKMFLKALNIDARNILYGPSWSNNSSMPRFAANLGLQPLEPIKSDILTPTPVASSPSNSNQKSMPMQPTNNNNNITTATGDNVGIPSAQFDWSGSGLVNPLDYSQTMLLDLEQLVASLDIPSTNPNPINHPPSPTSNLFLDEWENWLQSNDPQASKAIEATQETFPTNDDNAVRSQQKHEEVKQTEIEFSEFASYDSPKMIPLRETHIYNDCQENWLKPTILTPDLSRKEVVKETSVDEDNDDDEFDDFQMVLPETTKKSEKVAADPIDLIPDKVPNMIEASIQSEIPVQINQIVDSKKQVEDEDDEFTDFHSSAPVAPINPTRIEPLMPTIQYNTSIMQPMPTAGPSTTQINWPDPGVTDEDIRNIELAFSSKTQELTPSLNDEVGTKETKDVDDEWSDFVSVNPVQRFFENQQQQQRTATPDLPLSVLNLNNVQPPKQPIPVITPTGLIQTKLSSNLHTQQKATQPTLFKPQQPHEFQPAIVSNQFAANFYQGTNLSHAGFSPSHAPKVEYNQQQQNGNDVEDEEDWSDFVSSQPVANGVVDKQQPQQKLSVNNWAQPNIITNPRHLLGFGGGGTSTTSTPTLSSARKPVSSISAMPDLDFIAPNSRTNRK